MKKWLCLIGLFMLLTSCNNEVFVPRPSDIPDIEEPEPTPEGKDSLRVIRFNYDPGSLKVSDYNFTYQSKTTFINNTDNRGAYILFDNYNNSVVSVSSNTVFALPWVKEPKYMIEIPGLKDGIPGFYGMEVPFEFGKLLIPYQYMPGHKEYFDLPPHSQVTAIVTYKRKRVLAMGIMTYELTTFPKISRDSATVMVSVDVPVDISVEWGEIIPAE